MRRAASPLALLGGLLAIYLLGPVALFLWRDAHAGLGARTPGLSGALLTSAATATISTAVVAAGGIPLAYLLARSRSWAARVVEVAVLLPLALPPLMSGLLLIEVVGPYTMIGRAFGGRLTDSLAGVVLAQVFVAAPFGVVSARAAFGAVDAAADEMAATLGHRRLSRFVRVWLPLAHVGIRAGLVMTWLRAFGEFGATVILAYHPYTLPVYGYVQFGATGLGATGAPTLAALVVAAVSALALGAAAGVAGRAGAWSERLRSAVAEPPFPSPRVSAPGAGGAAGPGSGVSSPGEARPLSFDVRARVGTFGLDIRHEASSARLAVIGASGAGKSTLLRAMAGVLPGVRGSVRLGGRELGRLPPERRGLAYVPQDMALIAKQDVWRHATFARGARPERAAWWLDRLGLGGMEQRPASTLSGGQRRRLALVRALAGDPAVLLMDEPFAGLDVALRRDLLGELRRLQTECALSTVLVTHDWEDAAMLADEVVVVEAGSAVQSGSWAEVHGRPATPGVAHLLGWTLLGPGVAAGDGSVAIGSAELDCAASSAPTGTPVTVALRGDLVVARVANGHGTEAAVLDAVDLGGRRLVTAELGGVAAAARVSATEPIAPGNVCRLDIPPEAVWVWPVGAQG